MLRFSILLCSLAAASAASMMPSDRTPVSTVSNTPAAAPAARPSAVQSEDVTAAGFAVEYHGVARPSRQADLPPLVRGTIQEVHVREGQLVRRGTPLITLDNRVPEARLAAATVKANLTGALRRAEVDLRMAERRRDRLREVVQRGAAAEFELEELTAGLEQAEAAVQQQHDILQAAEAERQLAAAQLDQYTVSAPFDGTITEIHQRSGAVDPSVPLISMANVSVLEVEMHLPSTLYGSVQSGQQIDLRAGVPVTKVLPADVVSVSPVINSASNTFRCLLRLPNPAARYPAGFTVTLNSDPRPGSAPPAADSPEPSNARRRRATLR